MLLKSRLPHARWRKPLLFFLLIQWLAEEYPVPSLLAPPLLLRLRSHFSNPLTLSNLQAQVLSDSTRLQKFLDQVWQISRPQLK